MLRRTLYVFYYSQFMSSNHFWFWLVTFDALCAKDLTNAIAANGIN